ncbi:MAG: helix-turn-helix domain-containing protein [Mycobacteriales bacterium]
MATDDYQRVLGLRLRAVRTQRGLSLHAIERMSAGKWKAVVVGSYERGDRAVTVQKLAALAEFYGVPLRDLIPEPRTAPVGDHAGSATLLVLDLDRLARVDSQRAGPPAQYAVTLARSSGPHPGGVLPLGPDELRSLAVIYGTSPGDLADRLHQWGVVRSANQQRTESRPEPSSVGMPPNGLQRDPRRQPLDGASAARAYGAPPAAQRGGIPRPR